MNDLDDTSTKAMRGKDRVKMRMRSRDAEALLRLEQDFQISADLLRRVGAGEIPQDWVPFDEIARAGLGGSSLIGDAKGIDKEAMQARVAAIEGALQTVLTVVRAAEREVEESEERRKAQEAKGRIANAPYELDPLPISSEEVEYGIRTCNVYKTLLSEPVSDFGTLDHVGRYLAILQGKLKKFGSWVSRHFPPLVQAVAKGAATEAGKGLMRGVLESHPGLIPAVVEKIGAFLSLIL